MLKICQLEELDKWMEKLIRYSRLAVPIIILVEILMFFVFGITRQAEWQDRLQIYFLDYILIPAIRNIVIVGLGTVGIRMYYKTKKMVANYIGLTMLSLLSINIVYTHSEILVLVGLIIIPTMISIAVGDRRFTDNISLLNGVLLLMIQIKIVETGDLSVEVMVMTLLASALLLVIAHFVAKTLLSYYGEVLKCWNIISEEQKIEPMTGFLCKKAICDELEEMLEETAGGMLSIALINIDNMRNLIQTQGQEKGDKVIRGLVDIVKNCADNNVKIGRWGEDEFIIIFKNHGVMQVITICETIRDSFYYEQELDKKNKNISVSIGIATHTHKTTDSIELLVKGKEALKKAKDNGKNKTVVS